MYVILILQADLVNVGTVNCRYREQLCETLGVEVGTYFYTAGSVEKGEGKVGIWVSGVQE